MKITKVAISNFRSIEEIDIDFDHGCQILVGINESGKSNILRALALLDPTCTTSIEDLRIERRDQQPVEEGLVRFEFSLNEIQIEEIYSQVASHFLTQSINEPLIEFQGSNLNLKEFCTLRSNGLHEIKIPSGERKNNYWALPKNGYKIQSGWRKSKPETLVSTQTLAGEDVQVVGAKYFCIEKYKNSEAIPSDTVTPEELNALIGSLVRDFIGKNLPTCVYWKYSDKYLLPSKINIDEFIQNPDSCIPLKSIFQLAGYSQDQIATTISTARQQQPFRYINLLRNGLHNTRRNGC